MEIILSKRNKTLAYLIFFVFVLSTLYLFFFRKYDGIGKDYIFSSINSYIESTDIKIEKKKEKLNERSKQLYKNYLKKGQENISFEDGEALIFEKNGIVNRYIGEIFYFKANDIPEGGVIFLKKETRIYYLKKLKPHIYYIKDFNDFGPDFFGIKRRIPFVSTELKFSDTPVKNKNNGYHQDRVSGIFYFFKNLRSMNDQVFLTIKFLRSDFIAFYRLKKERTESIFLLIPLVFLSVFFGRKSGWILLKSLYFIMFNFLIIIIILRSNNSISVREFLNSDYGSVHIFALLYFSLLFLFFAILLKRISGLNTVKILFSSVVLSFLPVILKMILLNLSFPYSRLIFFSFSTILLISFFIVFKSILIILSDVEIRFPGNYMIISIILSALISIGLSYLFHISVFIYLSLFIPFFLSVYFKKNMFTELFNIFLFSVAVFSIFFNTNNHEKERFISSGLKNIFANQNNYAKFISREIIHNFNQRNTDMSHFFKKGMSPELKNMWRTSIAAKENIFSGIYVIDSNNELINSFSYRIPYLNIKIKKFFPFWEIDEFKTVYYGNTVSLAVAYINIYKDYEYLGKIIIQVIDSSDLIVKDRNLNNIFMLNKRIDGSNLSYIKLNGENQIIENPSNITLHDIRSKVRYSSKWIGFKSTDIQYRGFVFKTGDNTIIIFYPASNIWDLLSEIIRIFLLLLVINLLLHLHDILKLDWKTFFRTFSFQVFAILILLSLITAVIFSAFTLQYNRRSIGISYRDQIYNSDGIALNIISDILDKEGRLDQNNMFFLSKILDSDISIYLKNELLDTSNYKKILNSEIPLFVNSYIADRLEKKKEHFIIKRSGGTYSSFFNIYKYIVRIDHPYRTRSDLLKGKLFLNFIVNLFFILTLLAIFLAIVFRNKIIFPINILNKKMSDVESGNLKLIKDIPNEIEIRDLFSGFNSMVRGISAQKKKISEISRMKILVKISRWIAHEVKNPLTPIKLSAEQILRSLKDKRRGYEDIVEESVNYIINETEHLKNIAHGFLDFSNLNEIRKEEFDIVDLCRQEITKLQKVYNAINFKLIHNKDMIPVYLDKTKIKQVLKNILSNSIEAMPESKGVITTKVESGIKSLKLSITDTGKGLKHIDGEDVFNEEFSSKDKGTGLGLFIVKRIVEMHSGKVGIKENEEGNTVVTIELPFE